MTSAGGLVARCPAKVNLALKVLGRREDGFHEIWTLFQSVDLWDVLECRKAPDLSMTCDDPLIPTDARNLVLRAATRLRSEFRRARTPGARLHLRKAIPAGGGLGGGSADAAGALTALNRLWELHLPDSALAAIGGELGSDVPFFFHGGTAVGTGRGERIEPAPYVGDRGVVLATPPFPILTADVYRRLRVPLTPLVNDVTLQRLFTKLVVENDFGASVNDLEGAVIEGWPEIASFIDAAASKGAATARVSGSGSTVFAMFASERDARQAAAALSPCFPAWTVRATRTTPSGVRVEALDGFDARGN